MPAPTDAAEPLLEPPGVRLESCGFVVGAKVVLAANSVVVVLARITAPASRSAWTEAESRRVLVPSQSGEPSPVRHVGRLDNVLNANGHAVHCREWPTDTPAFTGAIGSLTSSLDGGLNERLDGGLALRNGREKRLEQAEALSPLCSWDFSATYDRSVLLYDGFDRD